MPVKINYQLCNGCGICYNVCPMDCYGWDEEKDLPILAHDEECWHEGNCVTDCPQKAIELKYPLQLW